MHQRVSPGLDHEPIGGGGAPQRNQCESAVLEAANLSQASQSDFFLVDTTN